jgi:hypothetical protein
MSTSGKYRCLSVRLAKRPVSWWRRRRIGESIKTIGGPAAHRLVSAY